MSRAAMPPGSFQVRDGELMAGGRSVTELAAEAGTPLYIYDSGLIAARVSELRAAMPAGLDLHYAIKANPLPAVVGLLAGLVDGLDVASSGELERALATGIPVSRISFAGPGKTDAELRMAATAGVTVNLESAGEMRRLAAISSALGTRARVAVRVNPLFELRQSGMRMGGGPKQFGVDEEAVPALLAELAGLPLEFLGFHIFAGSQILNGEVLIDCLEKTVDLATRLAADAPAPVRYINLGGGFGIPYFPGEAALDLGRIGGALGPLLARGRAACPDAAFAIELGRYLVGEAGLYVSRIVDRKVSRGKTFLVTDGGLHHHLALSGNFGQVIRKNYPLAIAGRMNMPATETADVVGCLCTPLDRLGDNVALPETAVGDLVVVFQSGAYGASASPAGFLGHQPAAERLV
ncbi:pyridoxal-dependent decarboxylase, exosortase A system-associated [Emcibacter sp. SYSU 3D8]|uniref:pyridoxal-dependent decarboxylase, exosortase A system-associated n=1 Tax=Emcibacter sp. SYSU 3D8 TaxID=3133969 RepID=UPI0031FE6BF4